MEIMNIFAADSPQIIQINLAYTIAALLVIVLGAGIAWGSLKQSVMHLEDDVKDIKTDIKRISQELIYSPKRHSRKSP
jgi:hypothetical protein